MTAKEIKSFKYGGYDNSVRTVKTDSEWMYRIGHVSTPYGYVSVQTYQKYRNRPAVTRINIIINGAVHELRVEKFYTERGLITVARRFAKQMAGE